MLSVLAARAAADPFGKVRKMIKDMIIKLMEEANEETEHKGWCDGELGANKVWAEISLTYTFVLRARSRLYRRRSLQK